MPEGGDMIPGRFIEGEVEKGMLSFNTGAQAGAETELVFGRGVEDNAIMLSGGSDRPALKMWGADGKTLWTAPGNVTFPQSVWLGPLR